MRIAHPNINLEVGIASHGKQTGEMLSGIESILKLENPDCVVVYGDTNSTLAGALAASKLNIPVAHVEAGLRSYERTMPEEQNRVVADHLANILFCPTQVAADNLRKEGITGEVWIVGDIMYDASLFYRDILRRGEVAPNLEFTSLEEFYLITLHRAENLDNPDRLRTIVDALNSLDDYKAVFPIHPRTRKAMARYGFTFKPHIKVIEPVGFFEMITLEQRCHFIVTDSGGVQKESFFFSKPCITLRDQTEWVETVDSGWNVLVGADKEKIRAAFYNISIPDKKPVFYGDGNSGKKILNILASTL